MVGILNERARITVCDVGAAAAQQQPLRCAYPVRETGWGQLVGKNGGLLQPGRKAGFAMDMLQQLEADIAHIEHLPCR